jgi:hypothetical protein
MQILLKRVWKTCILLECTLALLYEYVSADHRNLLELYSFSIDLELNDMCHDETRSTC